MQITKLDGALFKTLVMNGAENLRINYQSIDALNVFPVPDGDTGTNMKMTIDGGVNEIKNLDETNIYEVAKKLSRGMLMGARGNSGVILSQLFRGIYKGFEGFVSVNAINLSKAFLSGVSQAYKAVMKPVEGTILTVAREASEKLAAISSSRMSINEFFDELIIEAKASLQRTPDLLPVLKEAGVVDSGGAGLICILEGMQKALNGEFLAGTSIERVMHMASKLTIETEKTEFGYCTEFILKLDANKVAVDEFDEQNVIDFIEPLGNSIVVVKDDDIIKVHI
ncbi:MAG: DAK2 domain-containing protein, partial [Bacilli bacterium]|nr:DAK2 domain-containing protein [Bacilli bacterium]